MNKENMLRYIKGKQRVGFWELCKACNLPAFKVLRELNKLEREDKIESELFKINFDGVVWIRFYKIKRS